MFGRYPLAERWRLADSRARGSSREVFRCFAFRRLLHPHGPQFASCVTRTTMPTVPSPSKSGGPPGSRDREQGGGCHVRVEADRVAIWCAIRPKTTLTAQWYIIAIGLVIRCSVSATVSSSLLLLTLPTIDRHSHAHGPQLASRVSRSRMPTVCSWASARRQQIQPLDTARFGPAEMPAAVGAARRLPVRGRLIYPPFRTTTGL